jgi:hypothetical protein
MSDLVVTTVKIDKKLPNKIQLANIRHEEKTGNKRHVYEFISQAIEEKLKREKV